MHMHGEMKREVKDFSTNRDNLIEIGWIDSEQGFDFHIVLSAIWNEVVF